MASDDLTPAELAELRRLLAAATPGPWRAQLVHEADDVDDEVWEVWEPLVIETSDGDRLNRHNAALIAALVNAAPRLIEMAGRLLTEHAEMRHEH